jgi:hypothetical protein
MDELAGVVKNQAEVAENVDSVFYRAVENHAGVADVSTQKRTAILRAIAGDPGSAVQKLSKLAQISPLKIQKNLKKLRERRVLSRIGPDKGGHCEILEP